MKDNWKKWIKQQSIWECLLEIEMIPIVRFKYKITILQYDLIWIGQG